MNYKHCPHVNYYLLSLQINAPQAEISALAGEQEGRLAPMDMEMVGGVHAGSRARRDGDRAAYCVTHVSHCAGRLIESQGRSGRV